MFYFSLFEEVCLQVFLLYRTSVEQLHNEINALDTRIKKIKRQIELPATDEDIKSQMTEFLQVSPTPSLQLHLSYLPFSSSLHFRTNLCNEHIYHPRSPNVTSTCYNVE